MIYEYTVVESIQSIHWCRIIKERQRSVVILGTILRHATWAYATERMPTLSTAVAGEAPSGRVNQGVTTDLNTTMSCEVTWFPQYGKHSTIDAPKIHGLQPNSNELEANWLWQRSSYTHVVTVTVVINVKVVGPHAALHRRLATVAYDIGLSCNRTTTCR